MRGLRRSARRPGRLEGRRRPSSGAIGRSQNARLSTAPPPSPRKRGEAIRWQYEIGAIADKMLTILFDGIAYGMLLFVLASGLSVTLGLMNFINLAHGAFAMVGGYVTALLMNRAGAPVPRHPAGRLPRSGHPRHRARAHALSAALRLEPARSGAVHHRPRPDGDAGRRFFPRRRAAAGQSAGMALRQRDLPRRRNQSLPPVHRRRLRRSSPPPSSSFWSRPASARNSGRRSTTRGSPTGSASTSTAFSPSPSPSAAGSRASAGRSPPTWSGESTPRFRSSSW